MRKEIVALAALALAIPVICGCLADNRQAGGNGQLADDPAMLPQWSDDNWHGYDALSQELASLNQTYPDLVDVFSIGKSVQGRDLWCIRITDEKSAGSKLSCLIEGNIHGNEIEGGESCVYLIEYLLINFEKNATVRGMLESNEVYVVPMVNPDGREANTRENANKVDLNRNFDVDWGDPTGTAFVDPLGLHLYTNCGSSAFSEPETRACRDLAANLSHKNFSFNLCYHTNTQSVICPWAVSVPPFEIPPRDNAVFEYVLQWVRDNMVFIAGKVQWGNMSANMPYAGSGGSIDWYYMRHSIPTFCNEVGDVSTQPLTYWTQAALPLPLYLLTNAAKLYSWDIPTDQPALPEGVILG